MNDIRRTLRRYSSLMTMPPCVRPSKTCCSRWDCVPSPSRRRKSSYKSKRPEGPSCLVLDVRLPGVNGLDFQRQLADAGVQIPIIFITGHGDIPMTVKAMKSGAVEFLTKALQGPRPAGCDPSRLWIATK